MRLAALAIAAVAAGLWTGALAAPDPDMDACKTRGEAAIAACGKILKSAPLPEQREVDAQYYLGVNDLILGRYDDAIAAMNRVIALHPKRPGGYVMRGAAYGNEKQYDKALADFAAAITLDPTAASPYLFRCETHIHMKKPDLALPDCDKAISLKPDNADALSRRGFIYFAMKRQEPALADFNRAIALNPKDADALVYRGEIFGEQKDWDRALSDLKAAAVLRPGDDEILRRLSLDYLLVGRSDQELAEFDALVRLKPDAAAPYYYRSIAYSRAKKPAQALADIDTYIRLAPDDSKGYQRRAEDYQGTGQFSEASADYGQAIKLESLEPFPATAEFADRFKAGEAMLYASRCFSRAQANEELDAALGDCAQALRIRSDLWEAWSARGFVELRMSRFGPALADFNTRIEAQNGGHDEPYIKGSVLTSSLAEAYCGRSLAKAGLRDSKGSAADLATAKTIDPDAVATCQRVFGRS